MPERRQWVFFEPCGVCAFGVMEAGKTDSEAVAFMEFFEDSAAMFDAVKRGVTADLVSHDEYVRRFMPMMLGGYVCPHGGQS